MSTCAHDRRYDMYVRACITMHIGGRVYTSVGISPCGEKDPFYIAYLFIFFFL